MALFVTGEHQHIAELNARNSAFATASDLVFGPREDVTPEEFIENNKESKRLVTGVSAKYYGSTYVFYNRLSLETAFANQLVMLEFVHPVTTLYDQMDVVNDKLGTVFTEADLDNFNFDVQATEGIITLTAKAGHAFWKDSVTLAYRVTTPEIVVIPDVHLDGVMTPNDSTVLEQAALRYSPLDFMDHSAWLEGLQIGELSEADRIYMRDMLYAMDGKTWSATDVAEHSLAGVKLVYIGDDLSYVVNRQFTLVAVFELSASSTLATGNLYLHYTKPETP